MASENKILLNFDEDCEAFFVNSLNGEYEDLAEKARAYLEKYYKGNVGDILFNVFCQSSLTPSRVFTTKLEKYHQRVENGIPVDYSGNAYLRASKISLEDHNVCITGVWIEHCQRIGINPWLSFRMNDHHCWADETSALRSDFYYEAKEKGWLLGENTAPRKTTSTTACPRYAKRCWRISTSSSPPLTYTASSWISCASRSA